MLMAFKNILAPYENKWVALSPDRTKVIVAGETASEVDKKLRKMNNKTAILSKVLAFDKSYSP